MRPNSSCLHAYCSLLKPKFHYIYVVGDLSATRSPTSLERNISQRHVSDKWATSLWLVCDLLKTWHRFLILSSEPDLIYLTIRFWLGPICGIMADNDDDKIVVCCATLTSFACAYLSASMASNHGPVQNTLFTTQQTVNAVVSLLQKPKLLTTLCHGNSLSS